MKKIIVIMKHYFTLILFFSFCSIGWSQGTFLPFNNPNISYEGRIVYQKDAAVLSWSGTSVNVYFEGSAIAAILQDKDTGNYYNVVIDDKMVGKIHTDTTKHGYLLASNVDLGYHHLTLFKRTEWDKGKTLFFGFELPVDAAAIPNPSSKKRKIEFYGNSITCGYAIEDSSGKDSGNGYFENNYLSYSAIVARHFNAQYSCISKSGIGIMVSWFKLIMPEMYDRLDPFDSTSKWDFETYTPDVVVVHLLQNDSWLVKMPLNEQFQYRFGGKAPDSNFIIDAYKSFVSSIRAKYPQASIICLLGDGSITKEGSHYPAYVNEAVAQLKDDKIYTHFFAYKKSRGHPRIGEHLTMANDLIQFIEKNIVW